MNRKTILIIDKDLVSIAAIDQTLRKAGHQTVHTTDPGDVPTTISVSKPDLIICNLRKRDGLTVRVLRSSRMLGKTLRSVPVLFILQQGQRPRAVPDILGPPRFLVSPYSRDQLLAAVAENLRTISLKRAPR